MESRKRRGRRGRRSPRLIAVIPIYNEAPTVSGVLSEVAKSVDMLIAVDDGSTDETPRLLREWARARREVRIIRLKRNRGMAGALRKGFERVEEMLKRGKLEPQDILVNIDADGQHRPQYIPKVYRYMERKNRDIVLTRRDFSKYPFYKRVGNKLLSRLAWMLSGHPYYDVESGLRFMRAKVVPVLLDYFTGWRYSCAQEIALITAMKGFKVDNSFKVRIAYYRPGTTVWDGFIVVLMSFYAFLRVKTGLKVRP